MFLLINSHQQQRLLTYSVFTFYLFFNVYTRGIYTCSITAHRQTLFGPKIFFFYGDLKEVSIHSHLILLSLYKHAYYILKAIKHFLNGSPKILIGDPRYLYK